LHVADQVLSELRAAALQGCLELGEQLLDDGMVMGLVIDEEKSSAL
jgi:hypothetical protein